MFNTREMLVNKVNEFEAYRRINVAKSQQDKSDANEQTSNPPTIGALPDSVCGGGDSSIRTGENTIIQDDLDNFFYLEIFSGTGRLSKALRESYLLSDRMRSRSSASTSRTAMTCSRATLSTGYNGWSSLGSVLARGSHLRGPHGVHRDVMTATDTHSH